MATFRFVHQPNAVSRISALNFIPILTCIYISLFYQKDRFPLLYFTELFSNAAYFVVLGKMVYAASFHSLSVCYLYFLLCVMHHSLHG